MNTELFKLLFFAYIYFLWSVVNVIIATKKGRSNTFTFFASIIATPLLVYLYLLAVPPKDGSQ